MHRTVRRFAVLTTALAATLAVGSLAAPAQAAHPRAELGADWLTGQLTGGLIHNDQYDVDDHGLSIDTALGLNAIGGHRATVREISDALAPVVNDYITGEAFGDTGSTYAGPVAKTLVLAQTAKDDPSSFGGVDLVTRLEAQVRPGAILRGRLADTSVFGTDYANVLGQAFAAQGLAKAGSSKAAPALRFLLKQQCDRGYFRLSFTPSKARRDQTCDGGNASTSAPDTDATATAVIALQSLRSTRPAVRQSIEDALTWLRARQKPNGSFGGGTSTEGSNTNSTGLAAWALGRAGLCGPAKKAALWVRDLQVTGQTSGPLADENGAIAYTRVPLVTAETAGITVEARDQWRRATTQATLGLKYLSLRDCRAA